MRIILCLCLLLPACASQAVRCDGALQPINPASEPAAPGAGKGAAVRSGS